MQDDGSRFPSQCGGPCGDLDGSRALQATAGTGRSSYVRIYCIGVSNVYSTFNYCTFCTELLLLTD